MHQELYNDNCRYVRETRVVNKINNGLIPFTLAVTVWRANQMCELHEFMTIHKAYRFAYQALRRLTFCEHNINATQHMAKL